MMSRSYNILSSVFGYQEFRPPQDQVIAALLNGEDVFVLMPAGGGESLCYQIPALVRLGVGIV
jgi:ATP-dependent DNA helicase RecQ